MVDPFLHTPLHTHLLYPIDVVRCRFVIRRPRNNFIDFFLRIIISHFIPVHLHPCNELMMINQIFFECIARLVDIVYMHVCIIRIYFTATTINGHKHGLDTRSRLCHQAGRSRRSNRKAGYISTPPFHHIVIQLGIGLTQTVDKRIFFFPTRIINLKCPTFFGHLHRRTVCR